MKFDQFFFACFQIWFFSVVHVFDAKTRFMQKVKLSLTKIIRPSRTLFGFVPIVRKKVQRRIHRN